MRPSDGTMHWLFDFFDSWHGPRDPAFGLVDEAIPERLPPAIRALYGFAGRWPGRDPEQHLPDAPGLLQQQDVLAPATGLVERDGWFDVIFENQESWTIRVRAGEPSEAPYSNAHWMWDDTDMDDYVPLTPGLEHVLTSFVLQETLFGCRRLVSVTDPDAPAAGALWRDADPLWTDGRYVFEEPTHTFRRSGHLLLAEIAGDRWIGWNDPAATLPADIDVWARELDR